MVLAGDHIPADRMGLVHSFYMDRVSNPTAANQTTNGYPDGRGFCAQDIGLVVDSIGPILQDHGIDPGLYARALVYESEAVRALLGGPNEIGQLDPRRLAVGHVGDPNDTIDRLRYNFGN